MTIYDKWVDGISRPSPDFIALIIIPHSLHFIPTRLLKLSGRVLQIISFHFLGPDLGGGGAMVASGEPPAGVADINASSRVESPSVRRTTNSQQGGHGRRGMSLWRRPSVPVFHAVDGVLEGGKAEGTLRELTKDLPSSARFDAANRYLEVQFVQPLYGVIHGRVCFRLCVRLILCTGCLCACMLTHVHAAVAFLFGQQASMVTIRIVRRSDAWPV